MFRAKAVYSNTSTRIVKIEGVIREADILPWSELMTEEINKSAERALILDFSSVGFVDARAVKVLQERITEHVYLLNCSSLVRNILQTTGHNKNVLG